MEPVLHIGPVIQSSACQAQPVQVSFRIGSQLNYACQGLVTVSGCIGTERHDSLARKIIALCECVNDHRGSPPPYRTAYEDNVISGPGVGINRCADGGAGIAVPFCKSHFRTFSIIFRIRRDRLYAEQVCETICCAMRWVFPLQLKYATRILLSPDGVSGASWPSCPSGLSGSSGVPGFSGCSVVPSDSVISPEHEANAVTERTVIRQTAYRQAAHSTANAVNKKSPVCFILLLFLKFGPMSTSPCASCRGMCLRGVSCVAKLRSPEKKLFTRIAAGNALISVFTRQMQKMQAVFSK